MQKKYYSFFKKSVIDWFYAKKIKGKKLFKNKEYEENYIYNLDQTQGDKLIDILDINISNNLNKVENLRLILKEMYFKINHPFLFLAKYKRLKFLKTIDSNELQLLRDAKLIDLKNEEVENWWLDIKNHLKKKELSNKLDIGDEGENASIKFEVKKLKNLGINQRPLRKSIDDDGLGYDIESWNIYEGKTKQIFIEVKNNSFIFKSGQWREACSKKKQYYAHYWTRNCKYLKIIEFPELHKAVTQQINKEHPPGYEWTLKIPFSEGKPVEEYFNNF